MNTSVYFSTQIIQGRVLIIGDMNADSTMWNPHCCQKQNAGPLEDLIKRYKLIINNDTDFPTRPGSQTFSVIDLALTNMELSPLQVWEISEEYPFLSDQELIIMEWEDMDLSEENEKKEVTMTGWNIQKLLQDKSLLQAARKECRKVD